MVKTIMEIWQDDLLNRSRDAALLHSFLTIQAQDRSIIGRGYSLNIDSGWGYGKTFFLTKFREQLKADGHLAVYVNGWLDDSSSDPLVSVLASIEEEVSELLDPNGVIEACWNSITASSGEIVLAAAKGAGKRLLAKIIGDGVEEIIEAHDAANAFNILEDKKIDSDRDTGVGDDIAEAVTSVADRLMKAQISAYNTKIKSMKTFKRSVSALLDKHSKQGGKLPLFVLVDELDRCRPLYAIHMLEEIKHLFDIPNVVFVVSTETNQLSEAIKAVYGSNFDSKTYLKRFFDRSYKLGEPSYELFTTYLMKRFYIDESAFIYPPGLDFHALTATGARALGLSLRDLEQCMEAIHVFANLWPYKTKINLAILCALVFLQHINDERSLEAFEQGNFAASANPKLKLWKFTVRANRTDMAPVTFDTLLDLLSRTASRSLRDHLHTDQPSERVQQWVWDSIHAEIQTEYGGQFPVGAKPIWQRYPAYVRQLANIQ